MAKVNWQIIRLMLILSCLLLVLNSCIILSIPTPENKVLSGKPVKDDQLTFLALDDTKMSEVINHLGSPQFIWEEMRVFVYKWDMRQGVLLWAAGGGGGGAAGIEDIPKHYFLLIQFDENDEVKRYEKVVCPAFKSYANFLKEWVKSNPGQGVD